MQLPFTKALSVLPWSIIFNQNLYLIIGFESFPHIAPYRHQGYQSLLPKLNLQKPLSLEGTTRGCLLSGRLPGPMSILHLTKFYSKIMIGIDEYKWKETCLVITNSISPKLLGNKLFTVGNVFLILYSCSLSAEWQAKDSPSMFNLNRRWVSRSLLSSVEDLQLTKHASNHPLQSSQLIWRTETSAKLSKGRKTSACSHFGLALVGSLPDDWISSTKETHP